MKHLVRLKDGDLREDLFWDKGRSPDFLTTVETQAGCCTQLQRNKNSAKTSVVLCKRKTETSIALFGLGRKQGHICQKRRASPKLIRTLTKCIQMVKAENTCEQDTSPRFGAPQKSNSYLLMRDRGKFHVSRLTKIRICPEENRDRHRKRAKK